MKYAFMLLFIILAILLASGKLHAADQWFCVDESAKREGNTLWVCGVGEGKTEHRSRYEALSEALGAFRSICLASADCDIVRVSVEPKRLSCTENSKGWKCYQLIVVTIGKN